MKEKELSKYIDTLNAEKRPKEHGNPDVSGELEELFAAVRQVRSLKEPVLPGSDFTGRLARNTGERPKRAWLVSVAAVAAVAMLVILLNYILPISKGNIVYAMEKAFQEVKAYHGILEISVTNSEGTVYPQAKMEVWADQEGRYYVKSLEGPQKGLITVNNGEIKWQLRPEQKKAYIFASFPDPYRFTFELGNEVKEARSALKTGIVGEEKVSGRKTSVLEVSPRGGQSYRLWIDKTTQLPLQKQSAMQNALQYKVTYTQIDFMDTIPHELMNYYIPSGFEEISTHPEQAVDHLEEARKIAGFTPVTFETAPAGYIQESIAVEPGDGILKIYYVSQDHKQRVVLLESKADRSFQASSTAATGRVGGSPAEVQSPVQEAPGILSGGTYSGVKGLQSVRWQHGGMEYAVVGNVPMEVIRDFVQSLGMGAVEIPDVGGKPRLEVSIDLQVEENEQKNADGGHSPWKLDPLFVAQVFVSLKITPEGIRGEYPIRTEDLKIAQNDGESAIVEVGGNLTPIGKVYLKKLIRQDATGIWTVIGYDPIKSST